MGWGAGAGVGLVGVGWAGADEDEAVATFGGEDEEAAGFDEEVLDAAVDAEDEAGRLELEAGTDRLLEEADTASRLVLLWASTAFSGVGSGADSADSIEQAARHMATANSVVRMTSRVAFFCLCMVHLLFVHTTLP